MKKLFTLLLLLPFLSCEKDEAQNLSAKFSEKQIFNALVGTWRPSRLAYDENFKNIEYVATDSCAREYYVTFNADSSANTFYKCWDDRTKGYYDVKIGGRGENDTRVHVRLWDGLGIFLSTTIEHIQGVTLHHFTDSTLVFSEVSYNKGNKKLLGMFSEFKRVK